MGIVFGCIFFVGLVVILLLVLKRWRDIKRYRQFDENAGVSWDNPNYVTDTVQLEHQNGATDQDGKVTLNYGSDDLYGSGSDMGYSSSY